MLKIFRFQCFFFQNFVFLKVVETIIFWKVSLSTFLDSPGIVLLSPVNNSDEREATIYLFQFQWNLFDLTEYYQLCNCLFAVATFLLEKIRNGFGRV
jgi:hypothetical protein